MEEEKERNMAIADVNALNANVVDRHAACGNVMEEE
jgi:hypothetical protein